MAANPEKLAQQKRIMEMFFAVWAMYPQLRFWQLIENLSYKVQWDSTDMFFVPDDMAEETLRLVLKEGL